ncbi:MAG: hypothetical protein M3040_17445 [Bacteroidota bacterium]|nr:hypothetical protein [Bacteroidota bacterium]
MKPVIKILSAAFLVCLLLISCSKTTETPAASADVATSASNKIASGNWVISSYTQKTENKSASFAGVVFTFADGGKLTATKDGVITTGTWSHSPSSIGYYGSAPTKASLTVKLGTDKPFKNLTRIWNIVASDSSSLSLINPEPVDDEHLVFSKQ